MVARPVSNDGNDVSNPQGANPGVQKLTLRADSASIAVGSGTGIHAMLGTVTLANSSAQITVVSSDSTKVLCCAFGASVGTSTLTYFYNSQQTSIDITVYKNPVTGASAFMDDVTNPNTGVSALLPGSVQVTPGSIVIFALWPDHAIVFDSVPGAPSNITSPNRVSSAALNSRTFPTAGTFTFRCSTHGETGVVVVAP